MLQRVHRQPRRPREELLLPVRPGARAWRLSPAYDLTEVPGINGEHTTVVNGKGRGITLADLAGIGVKAGIPRASCLSIAKGMRERVADAGFTVRD